MVVTHLSAILAFQLLFTFNILCFSSPRLPVISVTSWTPSDSFNWDSTTPLPATWAKYSINNPASPEILAVPSTVGGISLSCSALYPVEWNIHHEQLGTKKNRRLSSITIISTTRKSDDIFKPETFTYISDLAIFGQANFVTGNYTCQGAADDEQQMASSTYLFWEGNSPPFLLYAGENRSVVYDGTATTVVLPCKLSKPDNVDVQLHRRNASGWDKVLETEYTYDPAYGFTLKNLTPNKTHGQYKCVVNEAEDNDIVLMNIIPQDQAPKPFVFKNRIIKPASLTFDTNKTQFVCCSNTLKPPKLMHLYCEHPVSCKLRKNGMAEIENAGRKMLGSPECTSYKLFYMAAGVLRCVGDGIDTTREYFFPMGFQYGFRSWARRNVTAPYYAWEAADHDKMLDIATRYPNMYVGLNVKISCQISKYYFSKGARWMITYKNGTKIALPEELKNETTRRGGSRSPISQLFRRNIITIELSPESEMSNVTCFAPEWNTSVWRSKSLDLNVEVPLPPEIDGPALEVVEWYVNETDKTLVCHYSGKPAPEIYWKKENQTFDYLHLNLNVSNSTWSSTITIPRVSYNHHGLYICNSSNFAGYRSKSFQVIVMERSSSATTVIIVLSVIAVFGLLAGGAVLLYRLKAQNITIRQLATAAFNDINNPHQTEESANATNRQLADQITAETLQYNRFQ